MRRFNASSFEVAGCGFVQHELWFGSDLLALRLCEYFWQQDAVWVQHFDWRSPTPSYAPQLNPMENVCEYLRANKLCSLVWDSYKAIVAACKAAWDFLIEDPERIRSIGQRDWACVKV
jgi:hypothetical protein